LTKRHVVRVLQVRSRKARHRQTAPHRPAVGPRAVGNCLVYSTDPNRTPYSTQLCA